MLSSPPTSHHFYDQSYRERKEVDHHQQQQQQQHQHQHNHNTLRNKESGGYSVGPSVFQSGEDAYRSQPHSRYHSGVTSNGFDSTHSWSPISNTTPSVPYGSIHSSSNVTKSTTSPPATTYFDLKPHHTRTNSSNALLAASREAASREQYQHAYAPVLHSNPISASPHLSAHGLPLPPSPRRQTSSNGRFGLQLGPITPSFGLPSGTNPGSGLSPSSMNSRIMAHNPLNTPLAMPRFNIIDHQLTPGGIIPASTLGPSGAPSKSWLDFPSPKAAFSPSHHSLATSLPAPGVGSSSSNAQFWPDGPLQSSSPYKRKPMGDYFSGAIMSPRSRSKESRELEMDQQRQISNEREDAAKRRRIEVEEEEEGKSLQQLEEEEREGEKVLDELAEDEVVGGQHVEDVLSTPLSLLAHASDAAAALKEGERRDSVGSKRIGATTMGLISPPLPNLATTTKRWFDNDRQPRLPMITSQFHTTLSPILSHRPDGDYLHNKTIPSSTMAPPFGPPARRIPSATHKNVAGTPPSLGAIGRSRSYTTVESVNRTTSTFSPPSIKARGDGVRPTVTEIERRAEVLGEGVVFMTNIKGDERDLGNTLAPLNLDYDAWEYRDGRARSRKSFSTASGIPMSVSQSEAGSARQSSQSAAEMSASPVDAVSKETSLPPKVETFTNEKAGAKVVVKPKSSTAAAAASASASSTTRRWQVMRSHVRIPSGAEINDAVESESEESELLGASHQNFFSFSIYHSKMDNESDMDPVRYGIIELRELEKLFDIFFARINPLLNLLDPFLHSVNYVRNRSALLTTVIASQAARLSDNGRDAELAVSLERYWRKHLLPEAILGGYKSVELAQAYLILSLYHKPTNRLSDDRSWQYLGFAIRIATEVGVNRATQPSEGVREIEQVRRRVRNRARLWISLFLADREQCFQTGRPWAIGEDDFIKHSLLWHREDFALPEDTRLIGFLKLVRIVANYNDALKDVVTQSKAKHSTLVEASNPYQWKEDVKALQYCLVQALVELDRWKDVWCGGALEEFSDEGEGGLTQAVAQLLDRWQVGSKRWYFYFKLTLCTRVLQSLERIQGWEMATADAKGNVERIKLVKEEIDLHIQDLCFDAWQSCTGMIESLLEESKHHDLSAAPNQVVVATVYGALAGLRLTRSTQGKGLKEGPDAEITLSQCKVLAKALVKAGSTPEHRNGAALSYGVYLEGIVTLWENNVVQAESCTSTASPPATSAMENLSVQTAMQVDQEAKSSVGNNKMAHSAAEAQAQSTSTFDASKVALISPMLPMSLSTPNKEGPPSLQQHHTVGDEVWGASSLHSETPLGGSLVASDPEAMDRMWDYLTTYPDPSSGFPLSLWQPHSTWTGAPTNPRLSNVAPTQ